jgi:hypothetical protein
LISYQNKSAIECCGENSWIFFKGNKKYCFETDNISFIKKSFWGLYSSFLLVIDYQKIRIPAESKNLTQFIQSLSQHFTKEQSSDFLLHHQRATFICFEMEKVSVFLKIFCFFIAPISFFIAKKIWECESTVICIVWAAFSIFYSILWTFVYYFLLKLSVKNFPIFLKIPTVWRILGVVLYMLIGICYRDFYFSIIYR